MTTNFKQRLIKACDLLAPLAFLGVATAMLMPFATLNIPGDPMATLTGLQLIYTSAGTLSTDHIKEAQVLLNIWRPTIMAAGIFALTGLLAIVVRISGSARHRNLFEKVEMFIGALGVVCMGELASDVRDTAVFQHGWLTLRAGIAWAAAASLTGLAAAVTAFMLDFKKEGDYRVGTLRYDNHGLARVFFWVLWGDFFLTFFAAILPQILPLQLRAIGCNLYAMGILMGMIPNIIIMTVTPIISFKSDRTRSRLGRRIPYMIWTTPFVVLFLIPLGFTTRIAAWTTAHASWFAGLHMNAATLPLLIVGALLIGFTFFSDFVNSIYWYLLADVVPEQTMGRFVALCRVVSTFAGLLFGVFVFKHARSHTELIYTITGLAYLVGFMMMCFKVKEGDYPPVPDDGRKPTIIGQARTYFRECFTNRVAVAFFLFNMVWAASNACAMFRIFFLQETAGISLAEIGRVSGWTALIALVLMYPTGMLVDYFKPLPTLLACTILLIPATFASFYIHDFTSFVVINLIGMPLNMIWDATSFPATVQILPKDRFGQFCSANSLTRSFVRIFLPLVGAWFIATTSASMIQLTPGNTVRVWRAENRWTLETINTAERDPLAMLQSVTNAAAGYQAATNQIAKLTLKGRLDLPDEAKYYYLVDPNGQSRHVIMPGLKDAGAQRWFFLSNTGHHGETLTLRQPRWQYMFFWQCSFMTVGLLSIAYLYITWRRHERKSDPPAARAETSV